MEIQYCKNCGAVVTAKFCGQCGAKYSKKEISMESLFSVIVEVVTNWEQKMVRTLKCLFLNPGIVARAFIEEDRRRYFHPVKFIMFWGGVNLFVSNYWKVGLGDIDQDTTENGKLVLVWLANYGTFFYIAVIPLLALSPYLFYRKTEPRFVHHAVILCYITGMNLLISIPTIALEGIWKPFAPVRDAIGAIFPFIFVIYFYYSYFGKPFWKSFLAGFFTLALLFIGTVIIIGGLEKMLDLSIYSPPR